MSDARASLTTGKRLLRCVLAVVGTIVAAFIIACVALVCAGLRDDIQHADIALVLGNKVETNGSPSSRLQSRLDKTIELYRGGWFPTVLVSGGIGKEGYDEALVMRDYLAAHGIPAERIIMDNQGVTTYASAANTLQVLRERKLRSVLVVSQYFHIPRTKLALDRFGISPIYSAHARFFEARDIYSIAREVVGYAAYSFRPYHLVARSYTTGTPHPE